MLTRILLDRRRGPPPVLSPVLRGRPAGVVRRRWTASSCPRPSRGTSRASSRPAHPTGGGRVGRGDAVRPVRRVAARRDRHGRGRPCVGPPGRTTERRLRRRRARRRPRARPPARPRSRRAARGGHRRRGRGPPCSPPSTRWGGSSRRRSREPPRIPRRRDVAGPRRRHGLGPDGDRRRSGRGPHGRRRRAGARARGDGRRAVAAHAGRLDRLGVRLPRRAERRRGPARRPARGVRRLGRRGGARACVAPSTCRRARRSGRGCPWWSPRRASSSPGPRGPRCGSAITGGAGGAPSSSCGTGRRRWNGSPDAHWAPLSLPGFRARSITVQRGRGDDVAPRRRRG